MENHAAIEAKCHNRKRRGTPQKARSEADIEVALSILQTAFDQFLYAGGSSGMIAVAAFNLDHRGRSLVHLPALDNRKSLPCLWLIITKLKGWGLIPPFPEQQRDNCGKEKELFGNDFTW